MTSARIAGIVSLAVGALLILLMLSLVLRSVNSPRFTPVPVNIFTVFFSFLGFLIVGLSIILIIKNEKNHKKQNVVNRLGLAGATIFALGGTILFGLLCELLYYGSYFDRTNENILFFFSGFLLASFGLWLIINTLKETKREL